MDRNNAVLIIFGVSALLVGAALKLLLAEDGSIAEILLVDKGLKITVMLY